MRPLAKCAQTVSVEKEGALPYPQRKEVPTERVLMDEGGRVAAPVLGSLCGHCILVLALQYQPLPGLANTFLRSWGDGLTKPFLGGGMV